MFHFLFITLPWLRTFHMCLALENNLILDVLTNSLGHWGRFTQELREQGWVYLLKWKQLDSPSQAGGGFCFISKRELPGPEWTSNWASSHHREKKRKCAIIKNWSDRGKQRGSSSQEQQAINRSGSRRDQGAGRTGLRRGAARSGAFRSLESPPDVSEDVWRSSLCEDVWRSSLCRSVSVCDAIKVKWRGEAQTWCGILLSGCFLLF